MGSPELSTVSLFSGIGGLDLGLERGARSLGIRTRPLCMVEGEAFGAFVLANAMQAGRLAPCPIWLGDVREFPAEQFRADIVVGGFPCQDISLAGKGAGIHGERSGLWFDMLDVALRVGARYLFLENVGAITVRGMDAVLGSLAEVGFDAEWTCVRASDVGAPHRRARWFCLAFANGERRRSTEPDAHEQDADSLRAGAGLADAESDLGRRDRRGEAQGQGSGWCGPSGSRAGLAYPDRDGLHRRAERDGEPQPGRPAGGEVDDALRCGAPVEHTLRGRHGQPDEAVRAGRSSAVDAGGGVPRWPPGRDDFDGWRYVLERWPWLAPALAPVRRVAHGPSNRTHGGLGDLEERCEEARTESDTGGTVRTLRNGIQVPAGTRANVQPFMCSRSLQEIERATSNRVDRLRALGNAVVPDQAAAAFAHLWERAHA